MGCRNGAQLLELGKAERPCEGLRTALAAMEPSFWSWEKPDKTLAYVPALPAAMEPSFWSWEKAPPEKKQSKTCAPQWSPAFGAGKSQYAACEDSPSIRCRNGAQLLELGKVCPSPTVCIRFARRNGAQLLELGKAHWAAGTTQENTLAAMEPSFWSWEKWQRFGPCGDEFSAAMEPSFWSWEKSSRFFHQLTTSVAHLCEQRKFWGRRVGLLLPDRLGKLALTRARALPRGTEGAGALARRSAGLGWVAPRGLQRI